MSTRKRIIGLVAALATILLFTGCKKSVEGETKSWTRNTRQIQELTALYPGFTAPLKEQLKEATALMDAAKKASDKESSAKQMAAANSRLSGGFVYKLAKLDGKKKKLRSKITSATTAAKDKNDRMAARNAAREARKVIESADRLLKRGAKTIVAAETIVKKVESDIDSATRDLNRVVKASKKKVTSKKKDKKDKADKADKKASDKKAATKQWKCSYCDKMNDHKATKCNNCNAPKE